MEETGEEVGLRRKTDGEETGDGPTCRQRSELRLETSSREAESLRAMKEEEEDVFLLLRGSVHSAPRGEENKQQCPPVGTRRSPAARAHSHVIRLLSLRGMSCHGTKPAP
ncbi:hypothetical protein CHARACLAT_024242 [Characodon lateralis]|uniref:Uncharacterized protein n=1 Tax=Characodon lateralis TaxID=208331 RepID=A0ABU7E3I2_9TELE|nr:hypothetical protein [Characodon lateralis]